MTRAALRKILIGIGVFVIAIAGFRALDTVLASGSTKEEHLTVAETTLNGYQFIEAIEAQANVKETLVTKQYGLGFSSELPLEFRTEVLDPAQFSDAFCVESIVGLVYEGPPSKAREYCHRTLIEKEWSALEGESNSCESFIKQSGTYRWLLLQYLSSGNETVIVVTSQTATAKESEENK